jgi:integrase
LKWAARNGLIQRDPIACVELEKDLARRETIHTAESIAAIERHADRTMWALFMVALTGGLRKREMRHLRWGDVDLETGIVKVRAENAKGGQSRFAMICRKTVKAIEGLRSEYEDKGIKSQWIFPAARDSSKAVSCQTMQWRWATLRTFAGIKGPDGDVWLHDARRSFATYATGELSLPDVLTLGGWKTPAVFFEHYHRLPPKRMKSIQAGLDRMVASLEIKPRRKAG